MWQKKCYRSCYVFSFNLLSNFFPKTFLAHLIFAGIKLKHFCNFQWFDISICGRYFFTNLALATACVPPVFCLNADVWLVRCVGMVLPRLPSEVRRRRVIGWGPTPSVACRSLWAAPPSPLGPASPPPQGPGLTSVRDTTRSQPRLNKHFFISFFNFI